MSQWPHCATCSYVHCETAQLASYLVTTNKQIIKRTCTMGVHGSINEMYIMVQIANTAQTLLR